MTSHKYPMIAAAVTVALGAAGFADAAVPSLSQAAAAPVQLVIAGSSAAESSVASAVETTVCGGVANTLVVQSKGGSGNFFAFSCNTAATISGITTGTLVTVYYRTEGGSVVGALPIVQNKKILRLNLADTTNCATTGAATAACTVNGVTATAGTTDSWTGGLTQDFVQLGVTDVEPAQLTNADFPTNYSSSVFGTATAAQLKALPTSRIFDQVFGLAVNTTGGGLPANSSTAGISGIHLSKEAAANILNGSYSDWSAVPDATTGNAVASSSVGVTRIDREPGSGTRTATNIFFLGYQCGTTNSIQSLPGEQLNFSTADELTQANGIPGAIAYTSIDQLLNPSNLAKWPNLALVTIDGVTPSTQAAAAGGYGFWFEATFVPNTTALGSGTGSAALATFLENSLPTLAGAPSSPDINVIPSYKGNTASVPLTGKGSGTTAVFVNAFSRLGNSCNVPAEQN
jgi:hypothetical protein